MDGGSHSLFSGRTLWLGMVDSTNTRLKAMAESGAPEGTVLLADGQTAGRGTAGREFYSPEGEGLYLSVLLRPTAPLQELLTLTGRAAVAVRAGIQAACGAPCRIKWLNDIWLSGRKLCGILTELSPGGDYVVLGVGVNVTQSGDSFAARGLGGIATSLAAEGYEVRREELAHSILRELEEMYRCFPGGREAALQQYRAHCLTVGRRVSFQLNGRISEGMAIGVDDDFGLLVDCEGRRYTVHSGTVRLLREEKGYE